MAECRVKAVCESVFRDDDLKKRRENLLSRWLAVIGQRMGNDGLHKPNPESDASFNGAPHSDG